ncbi:hypothetical protein ACH5RR_028970 [Cinchona calisaya]|uniref:Uncharacterized protein n=1 Tax=Cinchona calisaya TaxID=153742 RepID=A0ABD2YS22_9GENT
MNGRGECQIASWERSDLLTWRKLGRLWGRGPRDGHLMLTWPYGQQAWANGRSYVIISLLSPVRPWVGFAGCGLDWLS